MTCAFCGEASDVAGEVCPACGARADARCDRCDSPLPSGARFCSFCGERRRFAASTFAAEPPPDVAGHARVAGERRQLTVMFCDLVESTTLAARIDPEELREVLHAYHAFSTRVVRDHDGHVAQYLGDGLLVFFGYPLAHEDDPARAVRAALAILGGFPELRARLAAAVHGFDASTLDARIGIHTGPVVVGALAIGTSRETLAWGETVNLAARLQAAAPPGAAVISGATRRLVEPLFAVEALGERPLKGIAEPVAVFRVLAPARGSDDAARTASGASPLVAREAEIEVLLDAWREARSGAGRLALVAGEPGVGKSRLIDELRARLAGECRLWLSSRCSSDHETSPLFPVLATLRQALELDAEAAPESRLAKLAAALRAAGHDDPGRVAPVARLLSIPAPDGRAAGASASPESERRVVLDTLAAWLVNLTRKDPGVLVVEDLHWSDPSTLELLRMLAMRIAETPLLLVLSHRPGFTAAWPPQACVQRIDLERLGDRDAAALVRRVDAQGALPVRVLDEIVARAEGIPLYVEEFTRSALESRDAAHERRGGAGAHEREAPFAIPASLQDSLTARLDRLGEAKLVAQLAALLGREFPGGLLAAVAGLEPETLARHVEALLGAHLLCKRSMPGETLYAFKHALLQQSAYESLLKRDRMRLHARVVSALEEQFPQRAEEHPEILALHCERDGLPRKAIDAWKRAAERARSHSALLESIADLRNAVRLLLEHEPESPARDEEELELRISMAEMLVATSGLVSPEAEAVLARARELCQRSGASSRLFLVFLGTAMIELGRANNSAALKLAEQLERIAADVGDARLAPLIALPRGGARLMIGQLGAAHEDLSSAVAALREDDAGFLGRRQTMGVRVTLETWDADALWLLGSPDAARDLVVAGVAEASEPDNDPTTLAQALVGATAIAALRRETAECAALARRLVDFSGEHDLHFGVAHGTILLGWATADAGEPARGVALIESGIAALLQVGNRMKYSSYLLLWAEASRRLGDLDAALAVIERARDHRDASGEGFLAAEFERLRGELLLARPGGSEEGVACMRMAIEIADRQGAHQLALRALTSFTRLVGDEHRSRLEPMCAPGRDGWETVDAREARAVLAATPLRAPLNADRD